MNIADLLGFHDGHFGQIRQQLAQIEKQQVAVLAGQALIIKQNGQILSILTTYPKTTGATIKEQP